MDVVSMESLFDMEHDGHKTCRDCATAYVTNALKNRNVPIQCPFERCTHTMSEAKCFEVLREDLHQDWIDLSSRPYNDPGFRQCPVPDCKGFCLLDDIKSSDCECYVCHYHWCCNCQVDLVLNAVLSCHSFLHSIHFALFACRNYLRIRVLPARSTRSGSEAMMSR